MAVLTQNSELSLELGTGEKTMTAYLTAKAIEKSTFPVTAAFTDETGAPVVPLTLKWTLTDAAGNVINNRLDVDISTPAASVDIVLTGADLDADGNGTLRYLTIRGTYNSSLGNGLALVEAVRFEIDDLVLL